MNDRETSPEPDSSADAAGSHRAGGAFSIGMDDRYDSLQAISWWDQRRIASARILVAGAGALGNEVIKNLSLLGVGTVVIVDFDTIENSNLSRSVLFRPSDCGQPKATTAARAAMQLNPDCTAISLVGRIPDDVGLGMIREMDLVIGCVDNREARLWINRMCWRAGRPWIDGGIQEISGVAKVFAPAGHPAHIPDRGCYECTMTENDYRMVQLRYSCPLLTREEMALGRVPTAPTIASIVGGLQVQEALKLLHKLPAAVGSGLVFNGNANRFYQTSYPFRPDCMSHESAKPQFDSGWSVNQATPRQLIALAADRLGETVDPACAAVQLDRDFLVCLHCDTCGESGLVHQPANKVSAPTATCGKCRSMRRTEMAHAIGLELDLNEALSGITLDRLGFPPFDIVRIRVNQESIAWICLDADRPGWLPVRDVAAGDGRREDPS